MNINYDIGWHRHNSNTKQNPNDSGRSNVLTEGESEGGDGDHNSNSHVYDLHNLIPFEMQVYETIFTTVGALHR